MAESASENIPIKIHPKAFYHVTRERNLNDITEKGLLPAIQIDDDINYGGWKGDPDYVYLFHHTAFVGIARSIINGGGSGDYNFVPFEIFLPPSFPIERDYDVALIAMRNSTGEERRRKTVDKFRMLDVDFKGEVTKQNLRRHVDMVTDEKWEEVMGIYRTPNPIPPEHITLKSWDSFTSTAALSDSRN